MARIRKEAEAIYERNLIERAQRDVEIDDIADENLRGQLKENIETMREGSDFSSAFDSSFSKKYTTESGVIPLQSRDLEVEILLRKADMYRERGDVLQAEDMLDQALSLSKMRSGKSR